MRVRAWLRFALAAPLLAPLGAQQADSAVRARAPQVTAGDSVEQVLVDVRLERAAGATVQAYRYRDKVLLPVAEFLTLAEIQFTSLPRGRIDGVIQPEGAAFRIDGTKDTVTVGSRTIVLQKTEHVTRDGEVYLDADQLGAIFGISFVIEWSDLLVSVNDASALPVARRIRRDRARAGLLAQARQQNAYITGVPLGILRPPIDGAVLDYSATVPGSDPRCGTAAAAAFGANLFGGSLEFTATSASNGRGCGRQTNTQAGWTGVWLHNPWLRQLRIGEAITTGPSPRQVRGFSVSNSPYIRQPEFGTARYAGFLGKQWEVEAYRAGGLVAVDTADTTGRFDIVFPIAYGDNPVEFYAYGPHGEERRFGQSYRVVYDLVPRNTFEYGLSAGRCPQRITCNAAVNADLRYGLSPKWTVRGGHDYIMRDSVPDLGHPYARLTGLFTNAVSMDLRLTHKSSMSGELSYQPTVDRRLTAMYTRFDTTVVAPLLAPPGIRSQFQSSGFYRPSGEKTRYFLQWDVERTASFSSIFQVLQFSPSIQTSYVRYTPRVRLERVAPFTGGATTRTVAALGTFNLFPTSWGRFWGRLAASTNAEVDVDKPDKISQLGASLIARIRGNETLLTSAFSWAPGSDLITTFSLQTNRRVLRGLTQAIFQGTGFTALQSVQGSVLWNQRASSATFVAGPSLQRSGVTGRVYLDANGNGRFDEGDQPLRGVYVRAASSGAPTDSLGRFSVWDIPTFTPTTIAIDSSSLESPLWIPAVPVMTIEPGPNHYRPIDIAILPGGTIEGFVYRVSGTDKLGLPGVRVIVTNLKSGEKQNTSTFADGGYAFLGVRPGDYELTVEERVVTRFAGTFTARRVTLKSERDGAALTDIDLAIVTAPPVAVVIDVPPPPAPVDSDRDGVVDPADRCPNTPLGIRVDPVGCPILFGTTERTVTLRGVNFRTGSAVLTPSSLVVLDSVATTLIALSTVKVEVGGHTDSQGGATLNLRLSQGRAQSVMRYLARRGVPLSRLSAVGYGPRLPVADNTTAAGRAENRRVELRRIE